MFEFNRAIAHPGQQRHPDVKAKLGARCSAGMAPTPPASDPSAAPATPPTTLLRISTPRMIVRPVETRRDRKCGTWLKPEPLASALVERDEELSHFSQTIFLHQHPRKCFHTNIERYPPAGKEPGLCICHIHNRDLPPQGTPGMDRTVSASNRNSARSSCDCESIANSFLCRTHPHGPTRRRDPLSSRF